MYVRLLQEAPGTGGRLEGQSRQSQGGPRQSHGAGQRTQGLDEDESGHPGPGHADNRDAGHGAQAGAVVRTKGLLWALHGGGEC